jgi:raffinose/stachyose/melibiose transport system permease protein
MMTTTVVTTPPAQQKPARAKKRKGSLKVKHAYPQWFYIPAGVVYIGLFIVPTVASFYFAFTRWTIFTSKFIGLDNFREFFNDPQLTTGFTNTLIYAAITSGLKVILGMLLGIFLTSKIIARGYLRSAIFFPVLISTVGVGITFTQLMNPDHGVINTALSHIGINGPGWLTDPSLAIYSIALVDVWKGVGLATVIYIAGMTSIPQEYYEAAKMDGAGSFAMFRRVTFPLLWPATSTVIILSLIGGLRSFELIWTMTGGGPGFSSDVIASVIYKEYQAGFYGLSTAANVILFLTVTVIVVPLTHWLTRRQVEL